MNKKTKEQRTKEHPSPYCFYIAGGICLLWSLIFPLYRISDYCLMLGLAAFGWFGASKLLPKEVEVLPEEPVVTGDALADSAALEGRKYLEQLDALRGNIEDPVMKEKLFSIDSTVESIISAIKADPKKAPRVRRLMGYYLPTLIKFAGYFSELEDKKGAGQNVDTTLTRIRDNTGLLDEALKKQLDLLYESDALDISADIAVMENMLAREGLGKPDFDHEKAAKEAEETGGIVLTLNQ